MTRTSTLPLALLALLAFLAVAPAAAADDFAIVNATVHTLGPAGSLDGATVVVRGGSIAAVGTDVEVPAGIDVVDAAGRPVTPGIFDTANALGLVEISAESSTVDSSTELETYTAGFDVARAFNPRSMLIPVNRIEGLTRSLIVPSTSAHPIAGLGAVVHLGGVEDPIVRPRAALVAELGESGAALAGGSRAAALLLLEEILEDARDYAAKTEQYLEGSGYGYVVGRKDLEALVPVVEREIPLLVEVERARDIEVLVELAQRQEIEVVVLGGSEAWIVASRLAETDVAVVLDPLSNLPSSFETLGATLENASRLHAAGVRIAFTSGSSHNARNLTQAAGNAVANGLPWEEGLRAITATPASLWGVGDVVGTIEAGKDADLVLWDGDPLDVTTFADRVWIRGEAVEMKSRSTLLRDRYRQIPASVPPAWVRPSGIDGE